MNFQSKLSKPILPDINIQLIPTIQVKQCPSCQKKNFSLFEIVCSQGVELKYAICRWCGHVFLSTRFSDADLNTFYREEYRKANSGDAAPTPFNLEEQSLRGNYLAHIVQAQGSSINSHLDIGCSAGKLLSAIASAYPKSRSVGVEISDAHREICVQNGLRVFATVDELMSSHHERFDFISMAHVLEHIPNPVEFLSMLREDLLTAQGRLLIEVPNLFGHSSYEITHLHCFYEKTIRDVMRRSGYKVIFFRKHGIPRSLEKHERNLTLLAVPFLHPSRRLSVYPIFWWRFVKILRIKGLTRYSWPVFVLNTFLKGPLYLWNWVRDKIKSHINLKRV